ncbi:MAG: TfuA-like protein [Devosia sp.]
MKILFAGPSLHGSTVNLSGLEVVPPAKQGDLLKAVEAGARAIGLVDGEFGQHAAVWHKEILFALHGGVAVLGASSMGALRAAECAGFGMQPVGVIAHAYIAGTLDDDAAVALLMAPAEQGYAPLTEPLVDVVATLAALEKIGLIATNQHADLLDHAGAIHFALRTDDAIFDGVAEGLQLLTLYRAHRVSQKRLDAERLAELLRGLDVDTEPARPSFALSQSPYWKQRFAIAREMTNVPQTVSGL